MQPPVSENAAAAFRPEHLVLMRFRPMWEHVDGIRQFCGFFARTTFGSSQLGDRVGLVIHELVENAIKYSVPTDAAELEVAILHDDRTIEICVANSPRHADLASLRAAFTQLSRKSPEEGFLDAMRTARGLPSDQSGLGLARVRFEARMDLDLAVQGTLVRITARGAL